MRWSERYKLKGYDIPDISDTEPFLSNKINKKTVSDTMILTDTVFGKNQNSIKTVSYSINAPDTDKSLKTKLNI
jgi:hypothetical protein